MRLLRAVKTSPIGLDLGTHAFKAVQMKRVRDAWQSDVAVSLPRQTPSAPLEAGEIRRFVGVLERRGFSRREVVIGVPSACLLSAILELPARGPGVPLEQIAAAEFARVHKLEPAGVTMSAWELPAPARGSRATYMLAIGAKNDSLDAHVGVVESAGLDVVAVDEPCSATARGCLHGVGVDSGMTAVVDLGWNAATLAILKRDSVVYTRKLAEAGLARVFKAVTEDAECDAADVEQAVWQQGIVEPAKGVTPGPAFDTLSAHFAAALREIGQAVGYATHQYPDAAMNNVLLAGGGATIPGIAERFAEFLGIPTRAVTATNLSPVMTQAAGLALWTEAAS